MSLKVYLIRHGETEFNKDNREWGQDDETSLNELGILQAEKLAEALKGIKFNKLFSSDLKRAMQTTEKINKISNIKIISDPRLKEYEPGEVDPSSDEWKEKYSELLRSGMTKYEIRPFGGENIWDLIKRLQSFLEDIEREKGTIAILAHSGVNAVLMNLSQRKEKGDFIKIKQDNTCINVLEFSEGNWKIESINDSDHITLLFPKKEIYPNQKEIEELTKKDIINRIGGISKKIYLGGDLLAEKFCSYDRPYKRYNGSTVETYAQLKENFIIPKEWRISSILNGIKKYEIGSIKIGNIKHKINLILIKNPKDVEGLTLKKII